MGLHVDHRAEATGLGITLAELKAVRDQLTTAEHGLEAVPKATRRGLLAERLGISPAELTRLLLALTKGANGAPERAVVQQLARESAVDRR